MRYPYISLNQKIKQLERRVTNQEDQEEDEMLLPTKSCRWEFKGKNQATPNTPLRENPKSKIFLDLYLCLIRNFV